MFCDSRVLLQKDYIKCPIVNNVTESMELRLFIVNVIDNTLGTASFLHT